MNNELVIEILRWVGIVFVAGFIGYFGRYLSKIIINKFRKKEPEAKTVIHQYESPEKYKAKVEKEKLKLEKKRLKALKKKSKGKL